MLHARRMEPNPIQEASNLVAVITELLHYAAVIGSTPVERSEIRYAEALARTLADHLASMQPEAVLERFPAHS
jgi:hypothetical protein